MISGKSVLAIIPARGGSKGVPRKNIRDLCGKPLIAWTIQEAKQSKYIDRLVLSSEDPEIIEVAKKYGCEVPFIRPKELAEDNTPGIAPVLHAIQEIPGYDYVVLLQPTSPLRQADNIDGCIKLCIEKNASSCVSVSETEKNPYWMYTISCDDKMIPLMIDKGKISCRQDLPRVYSLNGAVYVAQYQWLVKTKAFVDKNTIAYPMSAERSIDIDSEVDLVFVKAILEEWRNGKI